MLRTVQSVIVDLKDRGIDDTAGNVEDSVLRSTEPGTVVCVAGGGPFDAAVLAMIVQLLDQNGVTARTILHNAASRANIGGLDLSGVTVIVLAYAELTQSPAHLRYLIKRLRQRASDAEIIVGLWAKNEAALKDANTQQAIGANAYVSSLQAVIEQTSALLMTDQAPI